MIHINPQDVDKIREWLRSISYIDNKNQLVNCDTEINDQLSPVVAIPKNKKKNK